MTDGFDYALDIAPFIKPRFVFRMGKTQGELYLLVHFGGSLIVLNTVDEFDQKQRLGRGGFNAAASPGFQFFLGRVGALVVEIGYAYSWFGLSRENTLRRVSLGQLTIRSGFAFAF